MPSSIVCGELFHVPLRSHRQAWFKTVITSIAYFAKRNRMADEGWHKRRLLELIASGEMTDGSLAWFARHYSEDAERKSSPSFSNFRDLGFELGALGVPASDIDLSPPPQPDYDALVARCLAQFEIEDSESDDGRLLLEGNVIRWQATSRPSAVETVRAQASQIEQLAGELTRREEVIERLQFEGQEMNAQLGRLDSELTKREGVIYQLQLGLGDLSAQFNALKTKTKSRSWLIRSLARQFRRKTFKL